MTAPARRLAEALEPLLADREVDLEDVVVSRAGKRTLVRIVVDKDGGIDLDGIASLNEAIGDAIEESSLLGDGSYLLEITSPGVDRPLTLPRHWKRNAGRLVKVTTADDTTTGRILDADDEAVVIAVGDGTSRLTYDQVVRAVVQIEFNKKSTESADDADDLVDDLDDDVEDAEDADEIDADEEA
jgi:ribosome maturation factor RimP